MSAPLVVIGYFGEPYLRVTKGEVDVNVLSPTAEMDGGLLGAFGPAELDNVHKPPIWRREATGPTARWHDLRAEWTGAARPPDVAAAPRRAHHISDWHVAIEAAGRTYDVAGSLEWTPIKPRIPTPLLAFLAVDTLALAAAALVLWRRRHRHRGVAAPAAVITGVS